MKCKREFDELTLEMACVCSTATTDGIATATEVPGDHACDNAACVEVGRRYDIAKSERDEAQRSYVKAAKERNRAEAEIRDGIATGLSRALVALEARAEALRDWKETPERERYFEASRAAALVRKLLEDLVDPPATVKGTP